MVNPEIDNYVQPEKFTLCERSESGVQWMANIFQRYVVVEQSLGSNLGSNCSCATQILTLFVTAKSAQEAVDKAEECLKASGIEGAYVKDVFKPDIPEIQLPYDYKVLSKSDRAVDIE